MKNTSRKSSTVRREEIAVAALRIIGEQGIASLTTTTLAAEVGVTSGALFRHFDSREAMLQEAAQYALAKIEGTFPDPTLPPLERLLIMADNRVRIVGADAGVAWVLRSDQAYLSLPADAVSRLQGLVKRSKKFVLTALRDGAKDGTIRTDIEPEVLFVPVMGTIHALIGMAGVHATATRTRGSSKGRVLAALAVLLAPPNGVTVNPNPNVKKLKR